jgi:hypothetical protein
MVTKIKSTKKAIIMFAIIGLIFLSCKTLTVQEFKENYDTIEVDGEMVGSQTSGSSIFSFYYNDSVYNVTLSYPPLITMHRKYKILIDKENPDKHYLVLLYKPIPIDTVPIVEGQIYITDYYKGTNEVWVYYKAIGMGGDFGKLYLARKEFYENVKYYDVIKKYKEEGARVVVDAYLIEQISDKKSRVVFKINYNKTNILNGYDYQWFK